MLAYVKHIEDPFGFCLFVFILTGMLVLLKVLEYISLRAQHILKNIWETQSCGHAARRNSMPIRFAARRPRDQSRAAAGAGESAAGGGGGGGQCFPALGTSGAFPSSPGRGSDSLEGWQDRVVLQAWGA